MRMKIEFATKRFPKYYNVLGVSLIKESIKKASPDYYEKLYFYNDKSNKTSKNFTYSFYIKGYEIEGDDFLVKDKVIMNISTPDLELGLYIYNGIINKKTIKYKDYEMTRLRVDLIKEKVIYGEEVLFNTLSPICIKDNKGKFLDVNNENYVKELNYIADTVLKNYRGYGIKKEIEFENLDLKKVVVKEPLRDFQKITKRQYQCVNSYKGVFRLKGDNEDLNDIYKLGLGFKRGQGFGNLEVVNGR
ncbi:CRISPR-associated endoribonuclease Cas6 [Terrisporobacter sp.]